MLTVVFVMAVGVVVALGVSLLVVADMVAERDTARRLTYARLHIYEQYIINCTARAVEPVPLREFWGRR